jgi:hypothetical protein
VVLNIITLTLYFIGICVPQFFSNQEEGEYTIIRENKNRCIHGENETDVNVEKRGETKGS